MRAIAKGAEPHSLTFYRAQPGSNYDDYQEKADLRASLVTEQRGLCCYCMSRIINDPLRMKIDHWRAQSSDASLQLNYANLLGACLGGQGLPTDSQHCDTKKANSDLKWNPAVAAHAIESRVRYRSDGTIYSEDAEFDEQLHTVLGLNLPFLKNNRKAVLDSLLNWWQTTKDARQKIQAQIDRRAGVHGNLEAYSPVALWFLRQRLGAVA